MLLAMTRFMIFYDLINLDNLVKSPKNVIASEATWQSGFDAKLHSNVYIVIASEAKQSLNHTRRRLPRRSFLAPRNDKFIIWPQLGISGSCIDFEVRRIA